MSLSTINSQYNGLNGLYGYGSFAGGGAGIYSDSYVDNVKNNIANGYEISATSNSYSNKANVSSSSFNQQCQTIEYLLQQGRTDDAMNKYNTLYQDMASNSYYQGYTENEIKTLLQEQYLNATGSTIINDATNNTKSSFSAGLESSIPIFGLLSNQTSKDDIIAEVTGTDISAKQKVGKAAGVAAGVAASGALGVAAVAAKKAFGHGSGKGKVLAAVLAGGAALLTYFGGKLIKNN